jgi:hypothetical protein
MDEDKREARRRALAELEGSWEKLAEEGPIASAADQSVKPPTAEMQAALDAAADRLVESLDPPPVSVPSMDDLDSGWGADEEDDEDEEDEREEPEPELPDEKLDPVAYAAAKKARDERAVAARERKRAKAEAKKARRKARLEAARGKQKTKSKKARPPAVARSAKEAKAAARAEAVAQGRRAREAARRDDEEEIVASVPSRSVRAGKPPPSRLAKKPMLSSTNARMLGIALAVFVAAAIFVAVITR